MTDRPINRCGFRGCPAIGHWPEGQRCPMHRGDEYDTARPASLDQQWIAERERRGVMPDAEKDLFP